MGVAVESRVSGRIEVVSGGMVSVAEAGRLFRDHFANHAGDTRIVRQMMARIPATTDLAKRRIVDLQNIIPGFPGAPEGREVQFVRICWVALTQA